MTVTIGIFEKEEGVLEAIKRFQASETDNKGLRIVLNNKDAAPMLAAQTDIPVEEVYGILDAQESNDLSGRPPLEAAPLAAGGYSTINNGVRGEPVGIVANVFSRNDGQRIKDVLREIGIPKNCAKECGEAVEEGRFLLIMEADPESEADSVLRQAGAVDVIH
ncbi:hypothetical protein [Paenibacillus sp. sgz302251]|uniref:hypothetical protein n=1 Tax=Paenibacillus sp. sgz302251 TaxID=3414493 RepID=UPI003C7E98D7